MIGIGLESVYYGYPFLQSDRSAIDLQSDHRHVKLLDPKRVSFK